MSSRRFHSRCGDYIRFTENHTIASRVASYNNGVVFTEQPVALDTVFQVNILEYEDKWVESISIGMTTQCPDDISVPQVALDRCDHADYWILDGNTVYHNGEEKDIEVDVDLLRVGQTVGCMVSSDGELHVYIDGVDKCILWTGLPTHTPFWGLADACECTTRIKLLPDVQVHRSKPSISKPQLQEPSTDSQPPELPPKPPKLPPKAPKVAPKPPKVPLRRNIDKVQVVKSLNLTSSNEQPPKVPRRRDANQVQVVKSLNLTSSDEQPPEVPRRKNVNQVQVVKSLNLTSSDGPSKETSATLNQQIKITHLQQENARLQKEVSRLQQDNALLQQKTNQLQSKLEQQPGLGCDADISFWVVSHKEVQITDQELGRGAWGRVLIGSFRGQDVAIKELHDLISSSDYYKDIFRREISLMAKVRHPNLLLFIAAVLDSPSNTPMIITELMDTNLRQAYHNKKLIDDSVKLSIMRDVAAALNYLHLQPKPIIHRDVNSANVLLLALPNSKWRGKLSDFGSANMVQHASTPGPGAIAYAAPEAAKEEQQSPKMDTYSFGKLLCEVFTSSFPDPRAFPSMLQFMATNWPLMYQLINSCVQQNPNKRPEMNNIVGQLNHFTIQQK